MVLNFVRSIPDDRVPAPINIQLALLRAALDGAGYDGATLTLINEGIGAIRIEHPSPDILEGMIIESDLKHLAHMFTFEPVA